MFFVAFEKFGAPNGFLCRKHFYRPWKNSEDLNPGLATDETALPVFSGGWWGPGSLREGQPDAHHSGGRASCRKDRFAEHTNSRTEPQTHSEWPVSSAQQAAASGVSVG